MNAPHDDNTAKVTEEELERQQAEELPDREVMSVVLPPDPFKIDPDVIGGGPGGTLPE